MPTRSSQLVPAFTSRVQAAPRSRLSLAASFRKGTASTDVATWAEIIGCLGERAATVAFRGRREGIVSGGGVERLRRRCPGTEPCNLSRIPPGAPSRARSKGKGQRHWPRLASRVASKCESCLPRRSAEEAKEGRARHSTPGHMGGDIGSIDSSPGSFIEVVSRQSSLDPIE